MGSPLGALPGSRYLEDTRIQQRRGDDNGSPLFIG